MSEAAQLVATVKRELKARGLTYRDVAHGLRLSEASVKRLFAGGRFTLARLVQVADLLGLSLAELAQRSADAAVRLRTLQPGHEERLVSDPKLLLTAVCVLNNWTLQDIVDAYRLTEAECVRRLLMLDRMGLVDLRPGNRVRLKVARDFDWLPDGPIRRYFRREGQGDFLDAPFDRDGESHVLVQGMFNDDARLQLEAEVRRLRGRFSALHDDSVPTPMDRKHGVALLLAMRRWEPAAFRKLRRKT